MHHLLVVKVGFKMHGVKGKARRETESPARHLHDPTTRRFYSGAEDSFVLTTPASLGRLTHVEIWHDSSGPSPDWYLRNITLS